MLNICSKRFRKIWYIIFHYRGSLSIIH